MRENNHRIKQKVKKKHIAFGKEQIRRKKNRVLSQTTFKSISITNTASIIDKHQHMHFTFNNILV